MNVKYRVDLSQGEREELTAWSRAGKIAARRLKRIQILLAAAADTDDETIASSIGVGGSTVYRTKRRFVEDGLDAALSEEPRPGAARKLSGRDEALLVATACSKPPPPATPLGLAERSLLQAPPEGRKRWTLNLLADAMVELTDHDDLSRDGATALGRERPQAVAARHVVHPESGRQLCRLHGRRARPLRRSSRSEAPRRVLRREPDPTDRRGSPAYSGQTGPARTL